MQKIALIAAVATNRVIGINNQLPWHLPADLAYFKQQTLGKPIIMGRKSYEAIGKPLPGRRNIVISRNNDFHANGCEVVHSIEAALQLVKDEPEIMITGGATLYAQALPLATHLYLTFVDVEIVGDTFFPEWHESDWQEIAREHHKADDKNPYDYTFTVFCRF